MRIVAPADFHTDSVISYFKLLGNEAGAPYVYANGGIWPHTTAWYILALQSSGRIDEAVQFLKRTLTLDGIAQSPMGQPAMYEYRFADTSSAEYGKIDKPSFLWAGGFYLNVLYRLFGVKENEWNLSISMPRAAHFDSIGYSLAFGSSKDISISGKGDRLYSFADGSTNIASLVLPLDAARHVRCDIRLGSVKNPYLEKINAILHSAQYTEEKRSLECVFSSFHGHAVSVSVIGPSKAKKILLDGKPLKNVKRAIQSDGSEKLEVHCTGTDAKQKLSIIY